MSQQILMVEDDEFLAAMVADTLRSHGWLVDTAGTVKQAVTVAGQKPVDLVLLDLRLPDGDGWTVLEAVRSRQQPHHFPVVIVTSTRVSRSELRQHAIEAYVPKPFSMPDLLARITKLLAEAL